MNPGKNLPVVGSASLIVLTCVIVDVALHRLSSWLFDFDYFNNGLPQSVLVKNGSFPIAAVLAFGVMFGFLALIYFRFRSEIGTTPWAGQRFFAPFAFIMFFGVFESAFVFPTPFKAEIITAIADAVPYLLLGALLGCVSRSGTGEESGRRGARAPWQSMLWVCPLLRRRPIPSLVHDPAYRVWIHRTRLGHLCMDRRLRSQHGCLLLAGGIDLSRCNAPAKGASRGRSDARSILAHGPVVLCADLRVFYRRPHHQRGRRYFLSGRGHLQLRNTIPAEEIHACRRAEVIE